MEWLRLDPVVAWILRLALAALFAAAAMHKIRDPRAFQQTLADYEILPQGLLIPTAIGLAATECSISLGLIAGIFPQTILGIAGQNAWAGLAASALLTIYGLAIGINLLRGRTEIDCGCLGPAARQTLSTWLLVRNGVLALGAALTSLPLSNRSLHVVDGITLLGGLVVLVLLFHTINLLASESSRWPIRESRS